MNLVFLILLIVPALAHNEAEFIYNGFQGSMNKLHLYGMAKILPNGLLQMTNGSVSKTSYAFYPHPITFKPKHLSFSTTFVFAMVPQVPLHSGHGLVFVISPSTNFQHAFPAAYLGLLSPTTNGNDSNHIFAIELDTVQNVDVGDINGNHVGIDVNSVKSMYAAPAAYYSDKDNVNKTLLLNSGKRMQIWIDYDHNELLVKVALAPFHHSKPSNFLLSKPIDLSPILLGSMYIGFTSADGAVSNDHYILGWSWNQSGRAQDFDLSKLPSLPKIKHQKLDSDKLAFIILFIVFVLLFLMISSAVFYFRTKKYKELYEAWEKQFAQQRFSYKELYVATKGFRDSEVLGMGGFGKVYKGVLPSSKAEVAVKQVSHDSKQGVKEFVAEISTMRRLSHRNLVPLLGYCRRKGQLLLIYEYMPNGSLDKFLFSKDEKTNLSWFLRFKIIKGVASALLYLHEEWEQVVLHRDVKASNVLLDAEMNARLGDFGLARLYDHNNDPRTTRVVGTVGYIAPEVSRTQKPTTSTDVFSFGMFLLEVGCGRRPIGKQYENEAEEFFLSDWVYDCWKNGEILRASDPNMGGDYQEKEMELVLKLGIVCLHPKTEERPTMRQVVQMLDECATLPDIPCEYDVESGYFFGESGRGITSLSSSTVTVGFSLTSSTNSVLQYGR
ncbi:L-type lectin-domain containing receptor kinase IV.1-like [Amaranthus tricolor]|uniref:L-type lectin-domain containing receptor kinase IV.1-like n=1 Tax=Amaranthus tricolor TaxID=29722 RepID=UPI0025881C8B|nr:L-type lectin-domain containing receptor kinase IV.1-like [Amaranthus tricolor]